MTTIAFDGKNLCSDTQVTSDYVAFGNASKIFKMKNGGYFAGAGDMGFVSDVARWLDGDIEDAPIPNNGEKIQGLFLCANGSITECTEALRFHKACIPWSGGTGETIAMTAMMLGFSAKKAVKTAIKLDIYSGGHVEKVKIKKALR